VRRRPLHPAIILITWGYNHPRRLHLAHRNHPRLVLPVNQALGPQGDHHRVPNQVGLDSAHNKDRLPADHLEGLSSSKDQREGLRRDHNLVREGGHHKVDQEGRADRADHPLEVPAHLNGQNKTSRSSWGSLFGTLYATYGCLEKPSHFGYI
jgi:hypothetical protein